MNYKKMSKLNKDDIKDIKDAIKENLENDFIDNYITWKKSLDEINDFIKKDIEAVLFMSNFDEKLLYSYDELCVESLNIVDKLELNSNNLNPTEISIEITDKVRMNKYRNIIQYYLEFNSISNFYF